MNEPIDTPTVPKSHLTNVAVACMVIFGVMLMLPMSGAAAAQEQTTQTASAQDTVLDATDQPVLSDSPTHTASPTGILFAECTVKLNLAVVAFSYTWEC